MERTPESGALDRSIRLRSPTADVTVAIGRVIGSGLRAGDLVVLDGGLGAGKTTMTRGIATGMGVSGPVSSPTFVIARTHEPGLDGGGGGGDGAGVGLIHVDAYRLGSSADLDDLDLESEMETGAMVAEWGVGRVEQFADSMLLVRIEPVDGEDSEELRTVEIRGTGSRWSGPAWNQLLEALEQSGSARAER
ncbi:MAG: tRNA (adenosine(37)-N6)-threonylcarbamoyltransferase complex ATPase subunit type 1 TsaE [Candidatus Nanopelagicales bacterium]|nr:tRNA (adenosine(37)-N6)-threonylcarbamoyltransferase complex ATPase subunit type 1 TsaE [Candidatus Nanopelagicales bacterium]